MLLALLACASPGEDDSASATVSFRDRCSLPASPPQLTDVAPQSDVLDPDAANLGVAAADFDGDGDLDLFLSNGYGPARLLRNAGGLLFSAWPDPPSVRIDTGASALDVNGDGHPDLYLPCGSMEEGCTNGLWLYERLDGGGAPRFRDLSESSGLGIDGSHFAGSWADYDRDGDLDLFQASKQPLGSSEPAPDRLFANEDGHFTERGQEAGLAWPGNSHSGVWLDYDRDGWPDLLVPVFMGENRLWHNEGDGSFSDATPDPLREPFHAFAALSADFDQDGNPDLLISGRTDAYGASDHLLLLGDGTGGWTDVSGPSGINDPQTGAGAVPTMGLQAGDLELDGELEVLFGNGSPDAGASNRFGTLRVDEDGSLRWEDRSAELEMPSSGSEQAYPYRSHGALFADLDEDGDVDLFLGNGGGPDAEPNQLWRNDSATTAHSLRLRLEGGDSNREGIGLELRVADGPPGASTWELHRQHFPGSGFNSTGPGDRLQVGTGSCAGPYHLSLRWPSGREQVLDAVPAGQEIVIEEPG